MPFSVWKVLSSSREHYSSFFRLNTSAPSQWPFKCGRKSSILIEMENFSSLLLPRSQSYHRDAREDGMGRGEQMRWYPMQFAWKLCAALFHVFLFYPQLFRLRPPRVSRSKCWNKSECRTIWRRLEWRRECKLLETQTNGALCDKNGISGALFPRVRRWESCRR